MTTIAAPPPMLLPTTRQLTLRDVSWSLYQHILREVGHRRIRVTFDEGNLEIMYPTDLHECVKKILARLIEFYAGVMGIEIEGFGSTTFDREDLHKGLEPDECYFVAHAANVAGRRDLNWEVDPPPDLAIEVDISPPDVQRQPIYAALGVPEIWRFDGREVTYLHRVMDGNGRAHYVPGEKSISFPGLPNAELNRFLQTGLRQSQSAAIREMKEWLAR